VSLMTEYKIVRKEDLNKDDYLIEVEAPHVAEKLKPGHFVILMTHESGERIPMSVKSAENGSIVMFIKRLGKTSLELDDYKVGDSLYEVIGPQGNAFPMKNYGNVVWCSDLVCGHAENYAYCEALSKVEGNHVISIQSFPTKDDVYGEDDLRSVSDEYYVTTIDGTYGRKGHYLNILEDLLEEKRVDLVLGCGDIGKLRDMAKLTKKYGVPAKAVLRQIMVDGTGMCGACRVFIDGAMKLTCVDGPLFDAHKVNFDEVINRLGMFKQPEQLAKELYLKRRVP
jgi:ferredoxin--NADP+ reductase